jgi:hypothetical protein
LENKITARDAATCKVPQECNDRILGPGLEQIIDISGPAYRYNFSSRSRVETGESPKVFPDWIPNIVTEYRNK